MRKRALVSGWVGVAIVVLPGVAWASDGGASSWPWYLQFLGAIINFAILLFLLFRFGGPRISAFLEHRQQQLEKQMKESAELRERAQQRLNEIEAQMKDFEQRRERLLEDYRRAGEAEKARIIESAEQQARRIREDAEMAAASERSRASAELEEELARRALRLAEAALREQMQPSRQARVVEQSIEQIEALSASQS
ncbi:MAG: ATP synthase F0 subunit B [Myxococcota bacterium]|nr:ATP synthase F0 subunit B [Myxococcota bacterium]